MKYFAKIKYLGTGFHGFQVQPNKRTVQGELSSSFERAFGRAVKITGCSRTDSRVHANEFCITVEAEGLSVPPEKLPLAMAEFLPEDICLFFAKECDCDFHPRYDAVGKEYVYRILNSKVCDPFEVNRAWFLPRTITDDGLERMRCAACHLLGEHDFSSFMSSGSDVEDTVRCVEYIDISRNGDIIEFRICANGFLYNMVRIIVGTLAEVAFGRFSPDDMKVVIDAKNRNRAGMTAPPDGLYLNCVNYKFPIIP